MKRAQRRRPNILWLMCDELRPDGVGCYGNKWGVVDTPNLDALAETGNRFDRFFVNSPICVSSRMAYLTGRRPAVTGGYGNEASYRWFPPETYAPRQPELPKTFVQMMADAGYATHNLGKQHLARLLEPFEMSDTTNADQWQLMQMVPQIGRDVQRNAVGSAIGGVWPEGHDYPHDALAAQAAAWLAEAPRDKPWLLRVSFLQPHTPVVVPEPFASRFVDQDWIGSENVESSVSDFERNFGDVTRPIDVNDEWVSLARARYYGLAAWLDFQIGRVLAALEQSGQRDSTVVVFCSDHGAGLGEMGNWAKHVFAPQVQGSPLIVAGAGIDQDVLRNDLCEAVDFAPTILALAGVEPTGALDGRDLLASSSGGSVYGAIGYGLQECLAQPMTRNGTWPDGRGWPQRFCVRDDRFRLDRSTRIDGNVIGAEDADADIFLADSQADPSEVRNLADDPAHRGARDRLLSLLERHIAGAAVPELADFYQAWPSIVEEMIAERMEPDGPSAK
ncbi:MAG: sulfatase-like hydrolase/transferase [Acidimicrobiaceae bacterium]|nr:sulfatase-like hydrolase/transferase [Acidimicrobiaceae bacterium]MYA73657.1 sulfatase-like hydrolase/transferase [Acidimicrobiaceae bacterium]MYC41188.1 sulfatase-like hydrolase/transferase [Acidimicrobiaceae bacterium]